MRAKAFWKNVLGILILTATAFVWGSSFVFTKQTLDSLPVFYVLTLRFLPSAAVLFVVLLYKLPQLTKGTALRGMVLGAILFFAYALQTVGLVYSTPARNAFVTVSYCVLTPFMMWLIFKQKPKIYNVLGGILCLAGLMLLALPGDAPARAEYLIGDGITLIGAIFFALQIIYIYRFQSRRDDPLLLLLFELLTVGVLSGLVTLCYELPTHGAAAFALDGKQIALFAYLSIVCTMLAQLGQMVGQRFASPDKAAILLSLESVFGTLLSVAMHQEELTVWLGIGFVLIFAALLCTQFRFDPLQLLWRLHVKKAEIIRSSADKDRQDETAGDNTLMDRSNRYAEQLSVLLAQETVSEYHQQDKSKFYRFVQTLRAMFPRVFATCAYTDYDGSFLLRWKGDSTEQPLLLMHHMDVVDAQGQWSHAPFAGDIADGRVWGRGALDTKGGLLCLLQAVEELLATGFVPKRDVYLLSSCTEETDGSGCDAITKHLQDMGLHFFLCLDGGGMIEQQPMAGVQGHFAMVAVGEKGCADLRFVAHSKGGAASEPDRDGPLVRLGRFMADADNGDIFPVKMNSVVAEMCRRMAPHAKGWLRPVLAHPVLFAPVLKGLMPQVSAQTNALLRSTLAFTTACGAEGYNMVPQTAFVTGNLRYSHHQGSEASIKAVVDLARKFGIETQIIDAGFASPICDYQSSAFALVQKAVADVFPSVVTVPYILNAASDSRYVGRICDNCIRFTPFVADKQQMASIHGLDENVSIDSLAPAVDFYKFVIVNA